MCACVCLFVAVQVWFQALEPDAATGVLPPPLESDFPSDINWLRLNEACALLLGDGGRVFVQPAPGAAGGDVVELRWGGLPVCLCVNSVYA